jgi:hypothetical protein
VAVLLIIGTLLATFGADTAVEFLKSTVLT